VSFEQRSAVLVSGCARRIRRDGFSVTLVTARQPDLIDALEQLAEDRIIDDVRRARDETVRQMIHSEDLATEIDPRADRERDRRDA
jgi:hypothetical protein